MRKTSPNPTARLMACVLVGVCVAGVATAQSQDDISHFAGQWINHTLDLQPLANGAAALRPEVQIGRLDSRLQLAPCARIEPYLPKGTQLWGQSRVGLKCLEGPVAWNVFLPVTVRAWGPAWVLKKSVVAHGVLTADDAELVAEVDWAENRSPVVPLPDQWVGMQAAFTLLPGQVLRQNSVRPPQVFAVGSQVRVSTSGAGFEMSSTGQALTAGKVGQLARVKLTNGKVVSGAVNPSGVVELSL